MKLPIRIKVAFLVSIIIFIFGLSASVFVFFETYKSFFVSKEQVLTTLVNAEARSIDDALSVGEHMVKVVSSSNTVRKFMANSKVEASEEMSKYLEHYNVGDDFSAIGLLTVTGNVVASTDRTVLNSNLGFRPYFKDAISGKLGKDMLMGVVTKKPGFYFTYPIRDDSGAVVGVALIKMKSDPIERSITSSGILKYGDSSLVDSDGVILFSNRSELTFKALAPISAERMEAIRTERKFEGLPLTPLTYEEIFKAMQTYEEPKVLELYDQNDKRNELVSLAKVEDEKYFLLLESGSSDIVRQSLMLSLLVAGFVLATTVAAAGLTVLALRKFLRPLTLFAEAAHRISEGDFKVNFNFHTGDEIETLGGVFNKMVSKLGGAYSELSRFRQAVDNASGHIIITDAEAKIIYANPAASSITGYSHEEIIGNNPRLWGGLMGREFYQNMWHQIKEEKKPFSAEIRNKRKNGEIYNSLVRISPIIDSNGALVGFVGLEDDITERIRAEEALAESAESYRSLFENMLDGLAYCEMIYDDQGRPVDFIYRTVNDRFGELTGLTDVKDKKVSEVIPGLRETNPELFEIYGRVASGGKPERFETYLKQLSIWFSISVYSPQKGYFVAVFNNVTEEKLAQEKLKVSEERFEALVENSFDVTTLLDNQGKILFVSSSVARILGYSPDELLGKDAFELLHPDDKARMHSLFKDLTEGRSSIVMAEDRMRHKDGSYRWTEVIGANLLAVPEIGAVIVNYHDVTVRKEAEDRLRASEERYRTLAEAARDMIFVINREGIITYVNSFGAKQFGLTPSDMVGKPRSTFFANGVSEKQSHSIKEVFESGQPVYRETETPFGPKKIWLGTWLVPLRNENGEIVSIMGVSRDITESKLLAKRLADQAKIISEEKAKDEAVIESIGDGLIAMDQDGTIVAFNRVSEKLLGWKAAEVIGKHFRTVWQIVDEKGQVVPVAERPVEQTFATGKIHSSSDYYYTKKDGSKVSVGLVVAPIVVAGRTVGVVDVFRDITREKEVDRMKTEFISLASHQLRTPLSAMKWFLEILLTDQIEGLNEKQKESLRNIDESNERMIALVNSLLNISRIEAGRVMVEPELTDVGHLINDAMAKLKNGIDEKKQKISVSVAPDVPRVMVDPKLVSQVYLNLLTNATKYSPKDSTIAVEVTKNGESVISKVSDNGYGIPLDEQSRVFNKFFRGTNVIKIEAEGTGLGLYLAKMIVEQLGGKIWFKSEGEDRGTTFWFSLPLTGMKPKPGEVKLEEVRI